MMNYDVAEGNISPGNETLCDVIPGNVTLGYDASQDLQSRHVLRQVNLLCYSNSHTYIIGFWEGLTQSPATFENVDFKSRTFASLSFSLHYMHFSHLRNLFES